LTHLAPQRLVVDCGLVVEIDMANVDPIAGFDEKRQRHGFLVVIGRGHGIDFRKRVTVGAEPVAHQFLGIGDRFARKRIARMNQQQFAHLRLGNHEGAGQFDLGDLENRALVDVHRDEHVVFFRRDRDLSRFDLKVRVAAVHVIRANLLQIALQGLARVAIVLFVPGQQIRRLQLEAAENVLFLEGRIADEVDHADFGALAFLDVDDDLDLVAGQIGDFGVDAHCVFAAAEVLIGQILFDLIEHRAIEDLAVGEPDVAQALLQIFGLDVFVALDLELRDRRPLDHDDEQRVAVAAQFDVAEKARGIHSAHRFADPLGVEMIADVDRQIVEDRAFRNALQALHAYVADRELLFLGRVLYYHVLCERN
jgi:hypothetical protein